MVFRKKKQLEDKVEARFQQAVSLIRDLDRPEFNRLIDGLKLTWEGYNRIRKVQTTEEKESAPIIEAEKEARKEIEKEMDYKEH